MNIRAILLVALLPLAACGSGDAAPAAEPPLAGAKIGGPFSLVDQDGRPASDRNFAGKWRVMYFGYTFCPDVCPTDVQNIAAGLKRFEAEDAERAAQVVPVFVTIDPARDTPAELKRFVAAFHPRMIGLTGSEDAIGRVAKSYAVYFRKGDPQPGGDYLMDHSRQAYLMDPRGEPVALVPQDQGPEAVAETLDRWVQ